jgi:hypothetical protein
MLGHKEAAGKEKSAKAKTGKAAVARNPGFTNNTS